jgi:hypothetical protein
MTHQKVRTRPISFIVSPVFMNVLYLICNDSKLLRQQYGLTIHAVYLADHIMGLQLGRVVSYGSHQRRDLF